MRPYKISVRRNRSKSGETFGWKARLTVTLDEKLKGRTVEIGLGTRSAEEAVKKAGIVAKAFKAVGLIREIPPIEVQND